MSNAKCRYSCCIYNWKLGINNLIGNWKLVIRNFKVWILNWNNSRGHWGFCSV
jgi:hypothetical protein